MPDPDGDLEGRVRELEREVARLKDSIAISRSDAAAARVLAGGADQDVSDAKTLLRAHTQTLNALRETQLEQQDELASVQAQLAGLRSEMQQGFGMLSTGMAQIVALLSRPRPEDDRPG